MSIISRMFPTIHRSVFLRRHFHGQHPLVHQGDLSRLDVLGLPGADGLEDLLASAALLNSATETIAMLPERNGRPQPLRVAAGQALSFFRAGVTVFFENVQIPSVVTLSNALLEDTGFPPACAANGLFVGLKNTGLSWHCDTKDLFVIQLSGAKRWRFAPNEDAASAVENVRPDPSALRDKHWKPTTEPDEVVLRQGAVLFLPRNWWHQTTAVEEPCVGLTCGIRRPSLLVLLLATIHCELEDSREWLAPSGPIIGVEDGPADTVSRLESRAVRFAERLATLDYGELLEKVTESPLFRRRYRTVKSVAVQHHRVGDAHEFRFTGSTSSELRCEADVAEIAAAILEEHDDFTVSQLSKRLDGAAPERIRAVVGRLVRLGVVEDRYAKEGVRTTDLAAFQAMLMAE